MPPKKEHKQRKKKNNKPLTKSQVKSISSKLKGLNSEQIASRILEKCLTERHIEKSEKRRNLVKHLTTKQFVGNLIEKFSTLFEKCQKQPFTDRYAHLQIEWNKYIASLLLTKELKSLLNDCSFSDLSSALHSVGSNLFGEVILHFVISQFCIPDYYVVM